MPFSIPTLLSLSHVKSAIKKIASALDTDYAELNENKKIDPALIDQDSSNRFVTDTEKSTWNGKESVNNKSTDVALTNNSDTLYPSQKAIKTYVDSGLGTKQNSLFDSQFITFTPINGYHYHDSFMNNSTPNSYYIVGNTTGSGSVGNNLIYLNGNSGAVRKPMASITSSGIGVAVLSYATNTCQMNSTSSIMCENQVSLRASTSTGYTSAYVGLSSTPSAASFPLSDVLTGSGLFWRWNPTLNNGKWQLIKVISGVTTVLLNTDYTMIDDIIYRFGIKYIKSTDTAYFYYDRVLIHTQTSISLPNSIDTMPVLVINTSNGQAANKMIHWHQVSWLFKYA